MLGVEIGETPLGFPLPRVRAADGVVQTTVGSRDIVVFTTDADGIHGFVDPGYSFEVTEAGVITDGDNTEPIERSCGGRSASWTSSYAPSIRAWQDDLSDRTPSIGQCD